MTRGASPSWPSRHFSFFFSFKLVCLHTLCQLYLTHFSAVNLHSAINTESISIRTLALSLSYPGVRIGLMMLPMKIA